MLGDTARLYMRSEWELLHYADGALVFNSYYGNHRKLSSLQATVSAVLSQIDGERTVPEVVAAACARKSGLTDADARAVLTWFYDEAILAENPLHALPGWLSPEVYARFRTELEWLSRFDTKERNGFRFFRRLRDARVGILGLGGTGSYCAMLLAAAGVGELRLIDGDTVDGSNLVRQVFFSESDASERRLKVHATRERIEELTSFTRVECVPEFVSNAEEVRTVCTGLDFLVLCADAPRFLLNRRVNAVCLELGLSYINAFAGFVGPLCVPGRTPCFSCVENHLRSKMRAGDYDQMVDALQIRRTRQYPSFGPNVVQVAQIQVMECVAHLTGAWTPKTAGGALKPSYGAVEFEEVLKSRDCACGASR